MGNDNEVAKRISGYFQGNYKKKKPEDENQPQEQQTTQPEEQSEETKKRFKSIRNAFGNQ